MEAIKVTIAVDEIKIFRIYSELARSHLDYDPFMMRTMSGPVTYSSSESRPNYGLSRSITARTARIAIQHTSCVGTLGMIQDQYEKDRIVKLMFFIIVNFDL